MSRIIKTKNLVLGRGRPKICGLVFGAQAEEILEIAALSNSSTCDMIEFRADYFEDVSDISRLKSLLRKLRRTAQKPMIFTLRTSDEGGKFSLSQDAYEEILIMVAEGDFAELIDVESEMAKANGALVGKLKEKNARVIISSHNFTSTPDTESILQSFEFMQSQGADIIKVAYMPNSRKDVLNLINAAESFTGDYNACPVIAISMGHLGMITRILGEFLGSVITFASLKDASAPGQLDAESMENVLNLIHNNYKKIILVGALGTGKTAVSGMLAANYGLKRILLNGYIERKEGMTLSDLACKYGDTLKDKETRYLRQVLNSDYQVISVGAGIILDADKISVMKENGFIVLLRAKPETVKLRMEKDPAKDYLAGNFDLEYIQSLVEKNSGLYETIADLIIDTDDKTTDETCREIVGALGYLG